jgi:DnaJ-domain-containing protein 1
MASQTAPEVTKLFDYSGNEVGVSTILILALVMTADEEEDSQEKTLLDRIAATSGLEDIVVEDILLLVRRRDTASIEEACRVLRNQFNAKGRRRFLELCISMVAADGYVTIPEQHVLRFLADLFYIVPQRLQGLYQSVVGTGLPPLGDPSSPDWWAQRTNEADNRSQDQKNRKDKSRSRQTRSQTASDDGIPPKDQQAYDILGLDPEASQSEIKEAYRRLAKKHHPDRYQQAGEEAVNAANERFRQIKRAYEHLT